MFVALRAMKEQLPTGEIKQLYPGDVVTTFDGWPYNNKISALNYRLVARVRDGEAVEPNDLIARGPDPQVAQDLAIQHGWYSEGVVPVRAPERAPAPAPAPTRAHEAELDPDKELAAMMSPSADATLACDVCDYAAATPHGLKVHKSRAHKE